MKPNDVRLTKLKIVKTLLSIVSRPLICVWNKTGWLIGSKSESWLKNERFFSVLSVVAVFHLIKNRKVSKTLRSVDIFSDEGFPAYNDSDIVVEEDDRTVEEAPMKMMSVLLIDTLNR